MTDLPVGSPEWISAFQHEELFDCMTHYGQGTIPYLEDQVKNSDLSDEERDRMVLLCEYLRRVHA